MKKLLKRINAKKDKIIFTGVTTVSALLPVMAHAEDTSTGTDVSAITGAITTGISDTKTQFLSILAVAVGGAMAFFAIKYAVNQGIGFFSKISKKG